MKTNIRMLGEAVVMFLVRTVVVEDHVDILAFRNLGDNLIHGDTVSHAWHDGVSDWWVDNHPITVCVGDAATWNNGNIRWDRRTLNRDHFWGHGNTEPDLAPAQQACLLWYWTEG